MENKNYIRFLIMLGVSFISMYFVMFTNVDRIEHVHLSVSRFYMTLLMIFPMALVMMYFMSAMYKNKLYNSIITITAVILFIVVLVFMRSQTFVSQKQYMQAMIPHHSSAILFSKNADINDPELKELTKQIIKSQEKEIAQMERILERLDK